jgi:maltose O-acetyltransferase
VRFRHRLYGEARFVYDRMRSDRGAPLATQALARLRALAAFRACVVGERIYAYGPVRVVAEGSVILGSRVFFLGGMIPTEVKCFAGATLTIGDESGFNYGASIEAHKHVSIGHHCMIASMVTICDSTADGTAPIVIGDNVWIAHGATIQPGAVIGNGSVVSAGSVVAGEIPPQSLALGNPARAMKLDAVRARVSRPP